MGAPRVVHEVSASLEMRLAELDLARLRAVFAELFSRVNEGVRAAGLDSDDVILERSVVMQGSDGAAFTGAVEWLSDGERLRADLLAKAGEGGYGRVRPDAWVLRSAKVRALAETLP